MPISRTWLPCWTPATSSSRSILRRWAAANSVQAGVGWASRSVNIAHEYVMVSSRNAANRSFDRS
ncbi:Uncharacterised protein [Mycobacterium tuberculosis]|uniref:Uncharacterized protein n=1 Tax=Mycobacterium tuberculosis TaxID=1773 RepID=A0A0U0TKW4_MYCTX|nr:Uncharacterised protein [Mycobacterium tuberculosis]